MNKRLIVKRVEALNRFNDFTIQRFNDSTNHE
jgi:hypothetical protein